MTITKKMKATQPHVKVVVKYSDIPVIINAIDSLALNSAEKREFDTHATKSYLQETLDLKKGYNLVRLELHMIYDVQPILRSIKNKTFFNGLNQAEIRDGELWTLEELMQSLPAEYENQLLGKEVSELEADCSFNAE
jgi:hypothetical protein